MYRDIVSALIFSRDGKLLLGKKDPNGGGVYPDAWHIPGGGVNNNESQTDALRREILEETGIDARYCPVTLADDQGYGETEKTLKDSNETVLCKMKFYVYKVQLNTDAADVALKLSDDLIRVQWADMDQLPSYQLTPPSVSLFKRLGYM